MFPGASYMASAHTWQNAGLEKNISKLNRAISGTEVYE